MVKKTGWGFIILVLVVLGLFSIIIAGAIGLFITEPLEIGNVAVIEVKGAITSFSSGFGSDNADVDDIVKFIEHAEEDKGVQAVVFLINSPGGAPVASDEIARAINRLNKTTVAVIRDVGASGAYWIATTTDHIIANPMSITGSIGVLGSYLEFGDLLSEYNVTYRRLVSGKYKDLGSPLKEMTVEEAVIFQTVLDEIHNEFVNTVAENRGMDVETVKELATGQFYTGRQALELGLIDELGALEEAEEYIKKVEKLEEIELAYYKKPKSFLESMMEATQDSSFNVGRGIGSSLKQDDGVRI